jgi:hypothetical protein
VKLPNLLKRLGRTLVLMKARLRARALIATKDLERYARFRLGGMSHDQAIRATVRLAVLEALHTPQARPQGFGRSVPGNR